MASRCINGCRKPPNPTDAYSGCQPGLEVQLPSALRKLVRRENCVVGLSRELIGTQLRNVISSKLIVVLRVIENGSALFSPEHYDVPICSATPFANHLRKVDRFLVFLVDC